MKAFLIDRREWRRDYLTLGNALDHFRNIIVGLLVAFTAAEEKAEVVAPLVALVGFDRWWKVLALTTSGGPARTIGLSKSEREREAKLWPGLAPRSSDADDHRRTSMGFRGREPAGSRSAQPALDFASRCGCLQGCRWDQCMSSCELCETYSG